ncbi:MAG: hypothetical protein KAR33_00610 [Candidatus Thorarchaeota archaeon]|nr:hypothetical protein [Candidatus Thorarchaeota archaeon]
MTGHAIEAILIIDKGGNPRFYMQIDPKAFGMDPVLASSFFAAIDMFSKQVFEQNAPVFQVDYGARVFTVLHGVQTNLVAVCARRLNPEVLEVLDSLLGEFEIEWLPATDSTDFDDSFIDAYLEAFGERIMSKLAIQDLPDSWVPYFTIKPDAMPTGSSTIAPYINGSRSVGEVIKVSSMTEEEALHEISRLWAHRVIRFRNMISFKDFLSARTQFVRHIQATSSETRDLRNLHPEMVGVIPRLAGLIDGRRTVREILAELRGQFDERELLRILDYLRETEVIEALSSEKRRILLAKEVLEIALRAAEVSHDKQEVSNALKTVMRSSETPETLGQLLLKDDKWTVDFDFKILEGLNQKRLMSLYGEWMKLLAQFVAILDRKTLDAFIDGLTAAFFERIVSRYTVSDLRGIEEFSFWLEQLTAEQWPHVQVVETYPLEKFGSSVLEDLVHVLITRGQVIYGSEIIVGLCGISGIPLIEGLPIQHVPRNRTDAFEMFMIEYSRLCPAAKLTVLILSRQRGISPHKAIIY